MPPILKQPAVHQSGQTSQNVDTPHRGGLGGDSSGTEILNRPGTSSGMETSAGALHGSGPLGSLASTSSSKAVDHGAASMLETGGISTGTGNAPTDFRAPTTSSSSSSTHSVLSHAPVQPSSRADQIPAIFPPTSARGMAAASDPRHGHPHPQSYSEAGHPARSVERMVQAAFLRGMCRRQPDRVPPDPSELPMSGEWSGELSRDEVAIVRSATDGVIQQARGSGY